MLAMINRFVSGKGSLYAQDWVKEHFANEVAMDIGTGWDVPTGIRIPSVNRNTLPGYPSFTPFDHWIPVTYISSHKATVYYADPIYNAPAYLSWAVPPPYESSATSNLVQYVVVFLW